MDDEGGERAERVGRRDDLPPKDLEKRPAWITSSATAWSA
jgi:hypothetical protein